MKKFLVGFSLSCAICFGQDTAGTPLGFDTNLTSSTTYQTLCTNLASGTVILNCSFYNFGPGVAEVQYNSNVVGFIAAPGTYINIGPMSRVNTNWFGRTVGATNTIIRVIRMPKR